MREDTPIACRLGVADYPRRLAKMSALGEAALVDLRMEPTRVVLRFADRAGIRARVTDIVAAESECCAFLDMSVSDEPGSVVLTIEGPPDAAIVLDELVTAFRGQPAGS